MQWVGPKTFLVGLLLVVLALIGYGIERLYVTPKEAVSNTIHGALAATTGEALDELDRHLHDQFFEKNPPPPLRSALRRYTPNSSGTFNRKQLRQSIRNFLKHTNVKRHYVIDQDIVLNGDRASVKLHMLTFYNDPDAEDRIERKFLSKWNLKLTRADDRWQITHLAYQN